MQTFPQLFAAITSLIRQRQGGEEGEATFSIIEVLDSSGIKLQRAKDLLASAAKWLSTREVAKLPLVSCDSVVLSKATIHKLEIYAGRMLRRQNALSESILADGAKDSWEEESRTMEKVVVDLEDLDNGLTGISKLRGTREPLKVGDRVANRSAFGPVPLGLRGTVVGVHPGETEPLCEVVFDEGFIGGGSLNSRCEDGRGKALPQSSLLQFKQRTWTPADDLSKDKDIRRKKGVEELSEHAAMRPILASSAANIGTKQRPVAKTTMGSANMETSSHWKKSNTATGMRPSHVFPSTPSTSKSGTQGKTVVTPKKLWTKADRRPETSTNKAVKVVKAAEAEPRAGNHEALTTSPKQIEAMDSFFSSISILSEDKAEDASRSKQSMTLPSAVSASKARDGQGNAEQSLLGGSVKTSSGSKSQHGKWDEVDFWESLQSQLPPTTSNDTHTAFKRG